MYMFTCKLQHGQKVNIPAGEDQPAFKALLSEYVPLPDQALEPRQVFRYGPSRPVEECGHISPAGQSRVEPESRLGARHHKVRTKWLRLPLPGAADQTIQAWDDICSGPTDPDILKEMNILGQIRP
ncbi:hypothetical protein A4X13_0g8390, partial [Tilletia indica]